MIYLRRVNDTCRTPRCPNRRSTPRHVSLAQQNKLRSSARIQDRADGIQTSSPGIRRDVGAKLVTIHNILGNRDGEVLDDPESFKTKEESKKSALDYIFQPHLYPDLYKDISHVVRINYYPPRGDNKEGWDNIDLVGWLGYKMQLKINFLCRDSILAAPIVLDLALFLDLAKRAGMSGIQEWLSFYFKSPMHAPGLYPEHDLFIQSMQLKNTLRYMMGEELTRLWCWSITPSCALVVRWLVGQTTNRALACNRAQTPRAHKFFPFQRSHFIRFSALLADTRAWNCA